MKYVIGTAIVGLLLGLALRHSGGHLVAGWTMLASMVVLPLAGMLTTLDEDLPGGFSNPAGANPPPWREWENWADLATRAAISGIGFSIDHNVLTGVGLIFLVISVAGFFASVAVHRRICARLSAFMAGESRQQG